MTASGSIWATYTYDAWGKPLQVLNGSNTPLSSTSTYFANVNPLRYRGYYYDTELGFYYLQSRYYDPSVGRFINADGQFETTLNVGLNLFAYCGNDPVNRADPDGTDWRTAFAIGATVAVVGLIVLGTIATGGGALALAGIVASATAFATATAVANVTIATGLTLAGGALIYAATNNVSSPGKMQKEVYRDQAPRDVKQAHRAHTEGQKAHVHFRDGTSINYDGTIHDKMGGIPQITKSVAKWLGKHGWTQIVK